MSNVEQTAVELRAIAAGIDDAAAGASAAAAKAGDIAARAAGSDFTGIASGMRRVQTLVQESVAPMRATSGQCREAAGPVAGAPKESSPQQTVEALSTAIAKTDSACNGLTGAIHKIDEAQRMAAAILHGGQPGPILAMLGEVKNRLVQMIQHAAKAKQTLAAAVAEARQTGQFTQFGGQGN